MDDAARIAQAVAFMWPKGPQLFGEKWPEAKANLLAALEQLDTDPAEAEAAAKELVGEIDQYPKARLELIRLLASMPSAQKGTRGFKPLPGNPTAVSTGKYVCPEPGCDFVWFRRSVGQPIPSCPVHHLPVIPAT